MPDDLQPDEGQGDASPGIFDPYLNAVPEDAREYVAGYLKDAEKNVNQRISQAADLEKTLGPYKDVDLSSYDPETLNQLIQWHQQISGDPDAYKQFIEAEAREMGITPAEAEEVIAAEEEDPNASREQLMQQIDERLAPLQEGLTAIQQKEATDLEFNAIQEKRHEIELKLGRELDGEEWKDIIDLGMPESFDEKGQELPMGDASWVIKGFDRLQGLHNTGSRLFLQEKAQVPGGGIPTGGTAALKPITDYKDAAEALRERFRATQS